MGTKETVRIVVGLGDCERSEEIINQLKTMYEVEVVGDSEEAYHTIHVFKPHLAILDFSLSKIHPIELYEGVALAHAGVTFVLCVTEDNYKVAQKIWKQRSVDFIFKPFFPLQFVNNLNTIVRNLLNTRYLQENQDQIKSLQEEIDRLKSS